MRLGWARAKAENARRTMADLSLRAPVWANDEIGDLGRAFNAMISSLDSSRQELERSNIQLKNRNEELAVLCVLRMKRHPIISITYLSSHGSQVFLVFLTFLPSVS